MNFDRCSETALIAVCAMILNGCDNDVTAPSDPVASDPAIGSIILQLEADTLSVGQSTQLHATILSIDGDTLISEDVEFLGSDDEIVTVDPTGVVRAVAPGTVAITARARDHTAVVTVYVRRAARSWSRRAIRRFSWATS